MRRHTFWNTFMDSVSMSKKCDGIAGTFGQSVWWLLRQKDLPVVYRLTGCRGLRTVYLVSAQITASLFISPDELH